jgi:hypothetical protein
MRIKPGYIVLTAAGVALGLQVVLIRQRDHEERMAKKDRRKRALGYALFGATVALGLTSRNRLKIEIKDN